MKKRGLFLDRACGILALFWFLCFVVSLAIPGLLLLKGAIEQPSFMTALDQTSSLYAPYVGAILVYYFAKRKSSRGLARSIRGCSWGLGPLEPRCVWSDVSGPAGPDADRGCPKNRRRSRVETGLAGGAGNRLLLRQARRIGLIGHQGRRSARDRTRPDR